MSDKRLKRAVSALILTSALLSGCTAGAGEETVATFSRPEEPPVTAAVQEERPLEPIQNLPRRELWKGGIRHADQHSGISGMDRSPGA